ncbi:hypothetical protein PIB30_017348 [Stylosanthes scabra]|uniref:Ribosome biogenesis protein slx9-like n=1 Tax=Stylosanthes scabra TaxID=79078 RepID=A0ABU6T7V8_9FABA|nr:hypothetical protein [Stylosanthes scabra]
MGKMKEKAESKSNHKLDKKLQFYSKVKDAVACLSAQKSITKKNSKQQRRQKKLKAYDLSALSELLPDPELKAPRKPDLRPVKVKPTSRQKILLREVQQFSAVLNNPLFQLDPKSAIHQHLRSTLPIVEEQQPKKKVNKNGSKKKKNKKSKASSSGVMSMEM